MTASLFLLLTSLFFLPHWAIAKCYYPNGTPVMGDAYVPCNNSMAGAGDDAPAPIQRRGQRGDSVLAGLMFKPKLGGLPAIEECLWVLGKGPAPVTPCAADSNTTRWCCGSEATECCNNWNSNRDSGAFTLPLVLGQVDPTTTTSYTSSTTTPPGVSLTPTQTSSTSQTSTPTPSPGGISSGVIAGIVIVCVAVVAALVGGGFYFWRRRRPQHNTVPELDTNRNEGNFGGLMQMQKGPTEAMGRELDVVNSPTELSMGSGRVEMPADGVEYYRQMEDSSRR
ncbi:hypothetical protein QBC46DRAFT_440162 [Diplogelasinospora grovesii]|uniref:Mid2 domain-containing protein n=1 Tax=Diplogelasinospora grovesii TaxID=303347 RepID=A0AAN6S2C0_9PEZI|nr:hypothetical protein QBC46DRAFT_440162 [Diplogelasinospora grovesii]